VIQGFNYTAFCASSYTGFAQAVWFKGDADAIIAVVCARSHDGFFIAIHLFSLG
jgi:hypothetical protein